MSPLTFGLCAVAGQTLDVVSDPTGCRSAPPHRGLESSGVPTCAMSSACSDNLRRNPAVRFVVLTGVSAPAVDSIAAPFDFAAAVPGGVVEITISECVPVETVRHGDAELAAAIDWSKMYGSYARRPWPAPVPAAGRTRRHRIRVLFRSSGDRSRISSIGILPFSTPQASMNSAPAAPVGNPALPSPASGIAAETVAFSRSAVPFTCPLRLPVPSRGPRPRPLRTPPVVTARVPAASVSLIRGRQRV